MHIQPSEFWRMKPRHFWHLVGRTKGKHSSLSTDDVARLRRLLKKAQAEDAAKP
jgi:hypothetical protein